MERAKLLRLGGYAAGVILIIFGIGTIAIGIAGKSTVEDELSQEKIVGSPDMSPEGIAPGIEEANLSVDAPDCDVAEEPITTGSEARCFAQYMRIHALESSGGKTYAEMGRFVSAENPDDPAGTSDEAAALKDESGQPVSNAARNTWVTETALATALNMSYMATGVAIFSIVVGVALILAGIGFLILAFAVFRDRAQKRSRHSRPLTRLKVRVGSTCSVNIKGASVYVTAVPYNQFSIPAEELTGDDGTATLVFRRDANFPASDQQQQLTLFIRATKPGEDKLAGVSTRRLVAVPFGS